MKFGDSIEKLNVAQCCALHTSCANHRNDLRCGRNFKHYSEISMTTSFLILRFIKNPLGVFTTCVCSFERAIDFLLKLFSRREKQEKQVFSSQFPTFPYKKTSRVKNSDGRIQKNVIFFMIGKCAKQFFVYAYGFYEHSAQMSLFFKKKQLFWISADFHRTFFCHQKNVFFFFFFFQREVFF